MNLRAAAILENVGEYVGSPSDSAEVIIELCNMIQKQDTSLLVATSALRRIATGVATIETCAYQARHALKFLDARFPDSTSPKGA